MILIGNTFPLSLIRRTVQIELSSIAALKAAAAEGWVSFWGHENTLPAAHHLLGFLPKPNSERPAVTLDGALLPALEGHSFEEVWVLSPDYTPGWRPTMGEEVPTARISAWQVLRIRFQTI